MIKTYLFWLFLFSSIGTCTELFLMDHTEDYWQWLPIVLFILSVGLINWDYFSRTNLSQKIFRLLMVLFIISGLIGLGMHYDANMEFILELYPSESGLSLLWKTIKGATPALAPATMIGLALLGWLFTLAENNQNKKLPDKEKK